MEDRKYDIAVEGLKHDGSDNYESDGSSGSEHTREDNFKPIMPTTNKNNKDAIPLISDPAHEQSQIDAVPPEILEVARDVSRSGGNFIYAPQIQDHRQFEYNQTNIKDCKDVQAAKKIISTTEQPGPSKQQQEFTSTSFPLSSYSQENASELTAPVETQVKPLTFTLDKGKSSIRKVKELQDKNRDPDLELQGINIPIQSIPVVHPRISEVLFYEGKAVPKNETYQPSSEKVRQVCPDKEVKFDNLLLQNEEKRFISLIGCSGSGKTTCSKRLAKTPEYLCLSLKFMEINYADDDMLTLRELLLDNAFPDLDEKSCQEAFEWIVNNQEKCVIIIDGMDQWVWSLNKKPPRKRYNAPQKITDLIASLCCKYFLSNVHLIITSRPHTMISLPKSLRPDKIYLLQDLAFDDMRSLFYAFAGDEADNLWQELNTRAPHLLSLCLCPLILLLYVRASLNPSNSIHEITTMTRIFATVLESLRRSDHTRHRDIQTIMGQLARISYRATLNSRVTITHQELKDEGLEVEVVQDLVIAVHGYQGNTSKLFEGDTKLYFCHQTFQEHLTAIYICNEMPLSEFREFIKDTIYKDHWSVVRKFVCGILMDTQKAKDENKQKREILKKRILRRMEEADVRRVADDKSKLMKIPMCSRRLVDVCVDVRECNDPEVTLEAAEKFPTEATVGDTTTATLLLQNNAHALSVVLAKVPHHIELLSLSYCEMDPTSFAFISSAIKNMPGSIECLNIVGNYLSNADVPLICEILPKVECKLEMRGCFALNEGRSHRDVSDEDREKLQQALNSLDASNLEIVTKKYNQMTIRKQTVLGYYATQIFNFFK